MKAPNSSTTTGKSPSVDGDHKMSNFYAKIGNAAHLLSLANVAIFCSAVLTQSDVLDPLWKQDGFCVSNQSQPYWTSHDLCLYVDWILCGVMLALLLSFRNDATLSEANQIFKSNIIGHWGHGMAHGYLAKRFRDGVMVMSAMSDGEVVMNATNTADETTLDTLYKMQTHPNDALLGSLELVIHDIPGIVFWVFIVRASMRGVKWNYVVTMALFVSVIHLFVPHRFGFTFVQTVLFALYDLSELMIPRKGFEYAAYALMVGVPLGLIGWMESTQCSKFVINWGGHLLYDGYIGVSLIAFYLACIWHAHKEKLQQTKEKAA